MHGTYSCNWFNDMNSRILWHNKNRRETWSRHVGKNLETPSYELFNHCYNKVNLMILPVWLDLLNYKNKTGTQSYFLSSL